MSVFDHHFVSGRLMMTAEELLELLLQRGIRLTADDGRLRYAPRSRVPDDLVQKLRDHKTNLMQLLENRNAPTCATPVYVYETPSKPAKDDGSVDVDTTESEKLHSLKLRPGDSATESTALNNGRDVACDWEELPDWPAPPCIRCQSLELWEDAIGRWRCLHCDPPTTARRFRQHAERIRARERRPGG